ncbi:NAD-dependent epimerase/dehydratase family protein [Plastoroseomonas hellenica]|uniref:NAD-dependent epimerase/dehydratase family protein n=1 Tax=Plastoroseomonas hellenica TaxID=2687306 RepID=UPI001BA550FC|nr:NAD-dependent epimerase/dehydratase family protein [Plastoroseomonas hellenica]MBR0644709.1 NAD-dependent epimerase/dehydratase family protein [Plastoroseomonas hellenica]
MTLDLNWAAQLEGPVLVLGAGGFVGANLTHRLLAQRSDIFAVVRRLPAWRLNEVNSRHLMEVDLNSPAELKMLLEATRPRTIFDCTAYGAYSFEQDYELIYKTNFMTLVRLVELMKDDPPAALIHTGSSSEYGLNSAGPDEDASLLPNSHYAVSKAAAAHYIFYAGKVLGFPVVNLRLYSVYGPLEDSSRLMPNLVKHGLDGNYPPFVRADISRDYVYVDDVCEACFRAAAKMTPELRGEQINIGTGRRTTMRDLALAAREVFRIDHAAIFEAMEPRAWDLADWYAAPGKAERLLGWTARTSLNDGLARMAEWVRGLTPDGLAALTKRGRPEERRSITAIIACYKDEQAIPIMYERLVATFRKINVDYEIIFVNDASPDNCAGVILELSRRDPRVRGITHSRNFGSQMAFRSGMEMATKEACVLLDGDLQDPPELIADFYLQWREGHDVVYGRRVKREMPYVSGMLYKAFYRVFAAFSYVPIPKDAGDFSLMDSRVVGWILRCPERDLFVRGLRAYVGFKQTGVDYVRPERMFGRSTNNLLKNIEWAKRGIFSFSNTPLKMLTAGGIILLGISFLAMFLSALARLMAPHLVPSGLTTIIILVLFFGALNLFAIGIVGEYVAKIMEEVKGRPRFIRAALISNGEVSLLLPEGNSSPT